METIPYVLYNFCKTNAYLAGMFHSSILHKKSMVVFPHKSWEGLTDRKIFKTSSRVGGFFAYHFFLTGTTPPSKTLGMPTCRGGLLKFV